MGTMMRHNYKIKNVDLHWNNIYQSGARSLFEGLELNDFVIQIDLSWNCLGTNPSEMLGALCSFIENNTELRHIDLSFNSLDDLECETIGKSLESNHTILGIHLLGNAGC